MKRLLLLGMIVAMSPVCWGQKTVIVVEKSFNIDSSPLSGFGAVAHDKGREESHYIACISKFPDCRKLAAGQSFYMTVLSPTDKRAYPVIEDSVGSILIEGGSGSSSVYFVYKDQK